MSFSGRGLWYSTVNSGVSSLGVEDDCVLCIEHLANRSALVIFHFNFAPVVDQTVNREGLSFVRSHANHAGPVPFSSSPKDPCCKEPEDFEMQAEREGEDENWYSTGKEKEKEEDENEKFGKSKTHDER